MKTFSCSYASTLLCCTLMIAIFSTTAAQILPGYEIYVTDAKLAKGQISELIMWPPSQPAPFPKPDYTSQAGGIGSLAIGPDGWVYYADENQFDIFRTNGSATNLVFRHTTYIRDLAFNSRGKLFFSEASGAGRDGIIYQFDAEKRQATVFRQIPLSELDGSWSGNFAFDPSDNLFASSGNRQSSSIYQDNNGHFIRKYNHQEPITGFAFVSMNTLLFTNHHNTLYKLDNFSNRTVFFTKASFTWISDVAVIKAPSGSCSISGRLNGGQKYWNMTFISARGPNLLWREVKSPVRVNSNGTYSLNALAPGRYKVYADLRADVGMGFKPSERIVECTGSTTGINFQWPSGN
jgi:hypothetical protein